jgi:hypothetical protein
MTSNAAKKFDTDKVDLTLVPPHLKKAVARVMMYGAVKYGRDNFKEGMEHHRVLAAALRHIDAFLNGQELDPESGFPHIWHAACNLGFLIHYQEENIGIDNLRKK